MATPRKLLGDRGEDLACDHLQRLGLSIIERKWRSGHQEMDIIAMDARGLHFVEVKSRTAPLGADPLDSITAGKRRGMVQAARRYVSLKGCGDVEIFFDIVTVVFDGGQESVNYFPQAFIPMYL